MKTIKLTVLWFLIIGSLSNQVMVGQTVVYQYSSTSKSSMKFSIDNGGQFNLNSSSGPALYPRESPNQVMYDGGVWLAARSRTSGQPIILKSNTLGYGHTDFTPGRLEDGDLYRKDLEPKYFLDGVTTERYESFIARVHDGDLRNYRYKGSELASLGYPLRINLTIETVALIDAQCDGCVVQRYIVRNMSDQDIDSLSVSFFTDVGLSIGYEDPPLNMIDKDDLAEVVQTPSSRLLVCHDVGDSSEYNSMLGIGVLPKPQMYSFHFHSMEAKPESQVRPFEMSDLQIMYSRQDSLVSTPMDIVVFATTYIGTLNPSDSAIVEYAIVPVQPGATQAERIQEVVRKYEYLALQTHVNENTDPVSRRPSIVHERGRTLVIGEFAQSSARVIDVTGCTYSLPVVGGTVNLSALPLGVYLVVSEKGQVLQRLCLVE